MNQGSVYHDQATNLLGTKVLVFGSNEKAKSDGRFCKPIGTKQ
jgi:hypothetical protein